MGYVMSPRPARDYTTRPRFKKGNKTKILAHFYAITDCYVPYSTFQPTRKERGLLMRQLQKVGVASDSL